MEEAEESNNAKTKNDAMNATTTTPKIHYYHIHNNQTNVKLKIILLL